VRGMKFTDVKSPIVRINARRCIFRNLLTFHHSTSCGKLAEHPEI
jgi:hypothetical protein